MTRSPLPASFATYHSLLLADCSLATQPKPVKPGMSKRGNGSRLRAVSEATRRGYGSGLITNPGGDARAGEGLAHSPMTLFSSSSRRIAIAKGLSAIDCNLDSHILTLARRSSLLLLGSSFPLHADDHWERPVELFLNHVNDILQTAYKLTQDGIYKICSI